MSNAVRVFEALRSFARAATVGELVAESRLTRDQVHKALKTLDRHQLLDKDAEERHRGLYQLVVDARRPETRRGRYDRSKYSPARAPSHAAQSGALRIISAGEIEPPWPR